MPLIEIDDNECGQLMAVLAHAEGKGITWAIINPLIMKIGGQLREHKLREAEPDSPASARTRRNDSGQPSEVTHE